MPAGAELTHLVTIVTVVAAVSVLRALGALDNGTVAVVFGAALGYPAGRAASYGPPQ